MPFPLAAAIAYGAIAGGGLAAGAAGLQRLWRYLTADPQEQLRQDEDLTPFVAAIAEALARAKFGVTINALSSDDKRKVEREAQLGKSSFLSQLNEAAKEKYGKPFSRLKKGEKQDLLDWLSSNYQD